MFLIKHIHKFKVKDVIAPCLPSTPIEFIHRNKMCFTLCFHLFHCHCALIKTCAKQYFFFCQYFKKRHDLFQRTLIQNDFAEEESMLAQFLRVLLSSDMPLYHVSFRINYLGLAWFSSVTQVQFIMKNTLSIQFTPLKHSSFMLLCSFYIWTLT